jgi:hypothetical protein
MSSDSDTILAFATKGPDSNEEARLLTLLSEFAPKVHRFDRAQKLRSGWQLFRRICREKPALVAMEGTGLSPGLACLAARLCAGVPFVVSSGDAVGPWVSSQNLLVSPLFSIYERVLCRFCAGFIGWTPYLVGRALTFGAPRAVTAAGWSESPSVDDNARDSARRKIRSSLGIGEGDIVFGMAGSLMWSRRQRYCYGQELVRAFAGVTRPDVRVLIVGDGDGMAQLKRQVDEMPPEKRDRVTFTGAVHWAGVWEYLAAMDVGSMPQSVADGVGGFRYTTKITEYAAARLLIVSTQIPMAYDLASSFGPTLRRLPGDAPWSRTFIAALTRLMETLTHEELTEIRRQAPGIPPQFDRAPQIATITQFVRDLLARRA